MNHFTPEQLPRAPPQELLAASPPVFWHDGREWPKNVGAKCNFEIVKTNLVLPTASLHLVAEDLGTVLLSFSFVNVLHENALVLEDVTLRFLVQGVISCNAVHVRTRDQDMEGTQHTHRCLSILPASLYFLNNRLKTRCLRIHCTLVGRRASAVPFLLPGPV